MFRSGDNGWQYFGIGRSTDGRLLVIEVSDTGKVRTRPAPWYVRLAWWIRSAGRK